MSAYNSLAIGHKTYFSHCGAVPESLAGMRSSPVGLESLEPGGELGSDPLHRLRAVEGTSGLGLSQQDDDLLRSIR